MRNQPLTTTTPTLQELLAQQREITRQIALLELPPLVTLTDALNKPQVQALLPILKANIDALTGHRKEQLGNLISVLEYVPSMLMSERQSREALANPVEPQPEGTEA